MPSEGVSQIELLLEPSLISSTDTIAKWKFGSTFFRGEADVEVESPGSVFDLVTVPSPNTRPSTALLPTGFPNPTAPSVPIGAAVKGRSVGAEEEVGMEDAGVEEVRERTERMDLVRRREPSPSTPRGRLAAILAHFPSVHCPLSRNREDVRLKDFGPPVDSV